jgi:hypothetical protein
MRFDIPEIAQQLSGIHQGVLASLGSRVFAAFAATPGMTNAKWNTRDLAVSANRCLVINTTEPAVVIRGL